MTLRGSLLAASAALLLGSVSAQAADLGNGYHGSIKDGFAPAPMHTSHPMFYGRIDGAFAHQDMSALEEPPAYTLSDTSIGRTSSFGFGVGYHFSRNVRGDLTFDWRRNAAVSGSIIDGAATVQGERHFGVKNFLMLANLYYDFSPEKKFSPYLGVGLGFSRNTTSSGYVDIPSCGVVAVTCEATFDGATKTHAAGALMAGFALKLTNKVSLDAGYRFLYLGDAHTGVINITRTPADPSAPDTTEDPIIRDMIAHEFRIGMRVNLR
mgnify:CR=1 FL=1